MFKKTIGLWPEPKEKLPEEFPLALRTQASTLTVRIADNNRGKTYPAKKGAQPDPLRGAIAANQGYTDR